MRVNPKLDTKLSKLEALLKKRYLIVKIKQFFCVRRHLRLDLYGFVENEKPILRDKWTF